jgi:hypothetical protein
VSDAPGHVYVVNNPAWPGWVKIGLVLGTREHGQRILDSRISNYNVADPRKGYVAVMSSYAACARTAEGFAHVLLSENHNRGKGEWWLCSLEEAHRLVEKACEIARIRPNRRKCLFEEALEKERDRVALSDTHKIMLRMIEEDSTKTPKKVEVAETAQAAHAVIEALLSQMAMPDENTEAAARAVLRRLDALGGTA